MDTQLPESLRFILSRRSIRAFVPGEVSDAQVLQLLQAAMAAPSAVARDPWRFVVIRRRPTMEALAQLLSNGDMLKSAALAIVVCGDIEAAHDRQLSYLLQDCSAAIENLLLAAHGLGLGACWLGVHPREERTRKIKELLGLPEAILPVACLAIGLPAENKPPRTRYQPAAVHYETW